MMISELLYVGEGPASSVGTQGIQHCATAQQAAKAIRSNHIAVVPTTDVAHDAILAMGYGPLWAAHATQDRATSPDDPSIYLS